MKEDYLWDKTGRDPEIEELENALAVFRYKETAPPELPAKVLPFVKKETPRSFMRYAFAVAACVAIVAISLGVWLQVSENTSDIKFVEAIATEETPESSDEPSDKKPGEKIVKVTKTAPVVKHKTLARKPKNHKAPKLTKEEKYAYDQLMLALSITSSKLKIVKDKIENSDDKTAAFGKER